jgi:glutamate N-acetyltransferase/amino-acid N-acetyltransferase
MSLIEGGIQHLGERIKRGDCARGGEEAVRAIMTTDTFPKQKIVEITLGGKKVKIGGIAKGAGMICPRLATMLCFLVTDASISREMLHRSLEEAVEQSFNRITIDGDTSTNDMVLILANGLAGNKKIRRGGGDYRQFTGGLSELTGTLARMIVQDGEGATKVVEILVQGAKSKTAARKVAFSIANSNLVKTALYGEDPNWGRIMAAIGNAGVRVAAEKINIQIGGVPLVVSGTGAFTSEAEWRSVLSCRDISLAVDLGLGNQSCRVWTCDLSPEYVNINARYHT